MRQTRRKAPRPFWVAAQTSILPLHAPARRAGADPLRANRTGDYALLRHRGLVIENQARVRHTRRGGRAIKILSERGADATTVDNDGNTALRGSVVGVECRSEMLVAAAETRRQNKRD
jgi:hypothetical protein